MSAPFELAGYGVRKNWRSAIIRGRESKSLFKEIRGSGAPADFAWPRFRRRGGGGKDDPPQASVRCNMAIGVGVEAIE